MILYLKGKVLTTVVVDVRKIIITRLKHNLIELHFTVSPLTILFIGDYTSEAPPQTLINKFSTFLEYALDLGKLELNYKLCGDIKLGNATSSGDKLYNMLQTTHFKSHFAHNCTICHNDSKRNFFNIYKFIDDQRNNV